MHKDINFRCIALDQLGMLYYCIQMSILFVLKFYVNKILFNINLFVKNIFINNFLYYNTIFLFEIKRILNIIHCLISFIRIFIILNIYIQYPNTNKFFITFKM